MNPVSGVIQSHLHKRSAVFVFPSQLSASFWIRKVLADGLADAVEKRRFISWDKFKEQAFTLNQERTPANRLTRIMFVEGELKTQGEAPLYTRLLPDAFPHALPRFKKDLVRLLPDLHSLVETLNDRDWEIARDVRLLHSRYTAFLEARGLFEPSSMMPEPLRGGDHYIVLFPELIEDYGVFSRAVSLSGYMETVSMDASATALPVMHEFGSQKNEFRWLFQSIRQRYEAGTPFSEMAVSVPCLDEIEDYLVQYARLYDVPLHVRRGRPLSCYPSQHVWRALADCAGAEFSFTEVKNLLLHMGTPFARRHELHALVRALKTHSCAGNWRTDEVLYDYIGERLKEAGASGPLRTYTRLKEAVQALTRAGSFASLKTAVQRFIHRYFDMDLLTEDVQLKSFQAGLDVLNDFAAVETRFPDMKVSSPLQVWLEAIEDSLYVPQQRGEGVQVFPYRVAAGIQPAVHFIVNASDEHLRVTTGIIKVLTEQQRRELKEEGNDMTLPFLSVYGASGREVYFSYSREGCIDQGVAPGFFLEQDAVVPGPDLETLAERDPLAAEERFWRGNGALERLYSWQSEGCTMVTRAGFTSRGIDLSRDTLSICREYLPRTGDGLLRLSATALDSYRSCGFRYLFRNLLKIDWDPDSIVFTDPRIEGILEHEVLKRFFEEALGPGNPFIGNPDTQGLMKETVDRVFAESRSPRLLLLPPEWQRLHDRIGVYMENFLEEEEKTLSGWMFREGEQRVEAITDDGSLQVEGIIDRISGDAEGRILIVDYKKKLRLQKSRYRNGADGFPQSIQIPLYVFLLKARGTAVDGAAYYDIESAKYSFVWFEDAPKAWCSAEDMDAYTAALAQGLAAWAGSMTRGEFSLAGAEEECRGCSFRPLCRSRYAVRS